MDMNHLPIQLAGRSFSYSEAIKNGLSQSSIRSLINAGIIEHVAKNLYQDAAASMTEENDFKNATVLLGTPSAICLLSALSFYGCTDEIPKKTWILVPENKRTIHRSIRAFRSRNPQWSVGIIKKDGYWITSLERTLVEAIAYGKRLGVNVGTEALRQAISSNKVKLKDLYATASSLGMLNRVSSILGAYL
jgi:predicted transcriptional regulator of viral defense system